MVNSINNNEINESTNSNYTDKSYIENKHVSYYYTNIDQLTSIKMEKIKQLAYEESPDIIGITEILTKHKPEKPTAAELNIKNYDCFYDDSKWERGTVLYIKKSLNARMFNDIQKIGFTESTWATYKSKNKETVLIGCIYRRGKSTLENNAKLRTLLTDQALGQFDRILIAGDFNYPDIDWGSNTGLWTSDDNEKFIVQAINDAFLIQHVMKPTRHRAGEKSNILDLVLTKDINDINHIDHCTPIDKSDHEVLKIFSTMPKQKEDKEQRVFLDYKRGNYVDFRQFIEQENWEAHLNEHDVENAWQTFVHKINNGITQFIPVVKVNPSKPKPMWTNIEVTKSIKKKHKLFKRYLESRNSIHYKEYVEMRNLASKQIKKAKKSHETKIAQDSKTNPKAFWKYINSKKKCQQGISALKKEDGTYTTNDKEKADILDKLFSSVFTRENKEHIPSIPPGEKSQGIYLPDIIITEEAVEKKLATLDPCKTPGADNLHPRILKELSKSLAKPLALIFNKSLQNGKLPSDWKKANVTAIFKKGEKSEANNYRPVSLTSVVCKVMESFIRDSIQNFLEDLQLYSKCQHGFRRKKSCTTQLLEVMDDFSRFHDKNENFDAIYLDFKKAFDSVPHIRLSRKLEAYGITGNLLSWIEDFLADRTQKVKVGKEESQNSDVISGIPQGSVLGPTLFTVFINDLPECVQSLCKIFADDTKVYNLSSNKDQIQQDLNDIQEWSDKWQLPFNASKCKCLHFGKNNPNNVYYLKETPIACCEEEKDLGITFDTSLKFNEHICNITKKANQVLGLIKRNFKYLDDKNLIKLYKALVRPHLEYGQSVWSPFLKKHKRSIENIQRRTTKLIHFLKNLTYEERLKALDLPSLHYRRLRGDLIQIYNLLKTKDTNEEYKYFFEIKENNTRGHNLKLNKEHCRTDIRKNSFALRNINVWNNLRHETVNAKNVNEFKNLIDKELSHLKFTYE